MTEKAPRAEIAAHEGAGEPKVESPSRVEAAWGLLRRNRRAVSWVLVVLWAVVIFLMSANTGADLTDGDGLVARVRALLMSAQVAWFGVGVDLVSPFAHFCEYALFGFLLQNALGCSLTPRRALLLAVVAASAYGVTDEFHQLFVPGRACDPVDWLVDTAGATLGAFLAHAALRRFQPPARR